ncbi:unnamed protein product [Spirodela intermedia]|uniref:Uncharacterized protein n=1 Tax=Spirodela intermedia TaxID=51605 RepID=A0A7I8JHL0_SPIIN|nr:unnamed protein product [Spirodela intermedia]CAA6669033.1 unnamed protein product [Spirodela intermedia]
MGVQGLWELLAPVGRRVSVETLAGKRSIWLVQFIKAMRDEKGEMVRNAHILGFFRRICKLLFLRTRPVFVFDGGTPRRHRENASAKIRKTAEKLLLNHLKAKKLEELAAEIKDSKFKDDPKGKHVVPDHKDGLSETRVSEETDHPLRTGINPERLDEMLAASIAAEEEGTFISNEATSTSQFPHEEEFDEDECEEMTIPVGNGSLDPTVLASLPPSMQLDLLVQMRERLMAENRQKYQKIKKSPSKFSELQIQSYLKTVAFRREIDEVQRSAAGKGPEGLQTSRIASESNREFVFSTSFTGDKRKFTPTEGEKSGTVEKTGSSTGKESIPDDSPRGPSSSNLKSTDRVNEDALTEDFGHDIETYRDERGRMRVSRVRGLGIRMTRDLQHNLELMLENDVANKYAAVHKDMAPIDGGEAINLPDNYSKNDVSFMTRLDSEAPGELLNRNTSVQNIRDDDHSFEVSTVKDEAPLEVSFSVDNMVDGDEEIFSQLVTGKSTLAFPSEVYSVGKDSNRSDSDSDCDSDWEDGDIEDIAINSLTDSRGIDQSLLEERIINENDGLNLEDGEFQIVSAKSVSRGLREEESEIQEAIRRSLEDFSQQSVSRSLRQDSSCERNEIGSSPRPDQGDGQNFMQDSAIAERLGLLDGAVKDGRRTINSPERLCPTNTILIDSGGKLPVTDVPDREIGVSGNVWFTQSNNDGKALNGSQIDRVSTSGLVGMPSCLQESCQDISINDEDKVDVLPPDSSDICVTRADINPDKTHGAAVLDSCRVPEEEEYRYDTSTHESMNLRTEALESTLDEELSLLSRECRDLGDEQRKLERNAESVNNEMFAECQELLQMFGLPFIIAPMEAEAQCAYMEIMNLVDGIVTDDSDAFLFGAQNVYKNIFDDRKYVETYLMKDIENELGLNREKLIHMALLLGSDYTEGVSGIGIVNAIEVVHAFPEEDGLKKFREWVESPDPSIFGKLYPHIGDKTKRRPLNAKNTNADECASSDGTQGDGSQSSSSGLLDVKRIFMEKHRNVSKNWHIPASFPSMSVVSAYINPQVDGSTEPFSWGKPDLPLLRKLCWEKFGWAHQKADELLVPVLKEYNKHETQLRLEAFYTFNEKFAKIRSQRIKRAVKGITGGSSRELMGDPEEGELQGKKRKKASSEAKEAKPEERPTESPEFAPESQWSTFK